MAAVVAVAPRCPWPGCSVLVAPSARAGGGFCSIRSCLTACRRRVVALMVQSPRGRRRGGYGWRPGRPAHAPQPPPGPAWPPGPRVPRPRLAPGPPRPPGRPPRPRLAPRPPGPAQATPMPPGPPRPPGAPPMPPGPHAPGPPAQAPGPPGPRATHPGACGTRSTLLSVVFQAFAQNSALPLHLGALSRKWPLDVGVRHAQTPTIKCDA